MDLSIKLETKNGQLRHTIIHRANRYTKCLPKYYCWT